MLLFPQNLGGSLGGGAPAVPLAFDFTSNRKMLYPLLDSDLGGSNNDGWAFYADFTYDGGNERYLLAVHTLQACSVSMHAGKIRVSNFSAFSTGTTTFSSGRHRVMCWYNGTTLKVWVKPDGGSRTLEINATVNYTTTSSNDSQIGGAFRNAGNSGLSLYPLMGKAYACAYWKTHPTEADATNLIDGVHEIGDVAQAPTWWPDPSDTGRDQTTAELTVKTFGETRQLTAPASCTNFRILRDPETGAPVTYDAGAGAKYWGAFDKGAGELFLATSTDLETWTQHGELFDTEANGLRPSDFLYLGNISGGHDPFLLLTTIGPGGAGSESKIIARTSSDMSSWTYDLGVSAFTNTALSAGGVEDFVVCRYDGAWYAVYEHDGLQDGTVAVGLAKSTNTLPSTGWSNVNNRAFPTPDAGFTTTARFCANPVCIAHDGEFWMFYEGFDNSTATRTFHLTLLKRTTDPENTAAWTSYGVVFYSLGRKCFPNSIAIESGEIALYMENGTGALSADGLALGKIEWGTDYLLVE